MKGETSMKKVIIYRSFDGEDFYTEEDCREYEADALACVHEIFDKVQFFDAFMGLMLAPEEDDVNAYLDAFEAAYDKAPYMFIIERPSETALDFIYGYLGMSLPDGVGPFKYDTHTDEWKAAE